MDSETEAKISQRPADRGVRIAVSIAAALALWCVIAPSWALASSPPKFEGKLKYEVIHATRVHMIEEIVTGGLEVEWCGEYAHAEVTGEAPPPGSPAWLLTECETIGPNVNKNIEPTSEIWLGTASGRNHREEAVLRHLEPKTVYYARFKAKNTDGSAISPNFRFETHEIEPPEIGISAFATGPHSGVAGAQIETNGAATEYRFEYATTELGPWKPFTSGATGTITAAEDFATPQAHVTGLEHETTYFVRLITDNEKGEAKEVVSFVTPGKPEVGTPEVRNVTATSVRVHENFLPRGSETHWSFEYATESAEKEGKWTLGPKGTVSQAEAEALPEGIGVIVEGTLTGLEENQVYFVRLSADNEAGSATSGEEHFKTWGPPTEVTTLSVHGIHGEALRVMGSANPDSTPTSAEQVITIEGAPTGGSFALEFEGQKTKAIKFNATAQEVERELKELSAVVNGGVGVAGPNGGPYTVYFFGENGEKALPQIVAVSELTPSSSKVVVTTVQTGGEAYDTHAHFEYVSQQQFEKTGGEGGYAKASSTPSVDLGSGGRARYLGSDLPALTPGERYHFRLAASNTSPGNPIVNGEDEVLAVPPSAGGGEAGVCANESLRTGLSAHLPDCRAYEQLTPVDKEGAQEIFNYGGHLENEAALPGEGGDHVEYGSPAVKWGKGPGAGQSPYFFERTEAGWQVTAATAQPEAGILRYTPQLLAVDLPALALEASWFTSPSNPSPKIEYKVGPAGGPYATLPPVPRSQATHGWVAASKDFSTQVLQVADRTLAGHPTHTLEGDDLYEYAKGELRQVNVIGPPPGKTIGSCGARIARGSNSEFLFEEGSSGKASSYAVSANGSRIFFEVPVKMCSEADAEELYMRIGGEQTVDVGAYRFIAANPQGSMALLERRDGPGVENPGLYLYNVESQSAEFLPSSAIALAPTVTTLGARLSVSEDLGVVYIRTAGGALYRYDVREKHSKFLLQLTPSKGHSFYEVSPDGRYFYFVVEEVGGLPGGGVEPENTRFAEHGQTSQMYRYGSGEEAVECISCASSIDPEPKLSAVGPEGRAKMTASANGDYAFFDTPAALVLADVDGETAPENIKANGGEHGSSNYSLSSDVYEWRRDGVDGCSQLRGCLALITSGNGGFLNILLGTVPSGRDVFFATNESLVGSDKDTASDIYDARIGGGFPEPSIPTQCEGDACSRPFSPPNDLTPASATFQGTGNVTQAPVSKPKPKGKAKHKTRCRSRSRRRCKPRSKKATKKARRTGHTGARGRTGAGR